MYRRLLAIVISTVVLLTGCGQKTSDVAQGNQPSDDELTAMYAAEEIGNAFGDEFPEWFGGAYPETDRCIVLLAENTEENQARIIQLSTYADILLFEKCTYSYSYLRELYTKVQAYQENNAELKKFYISTRDNCVIVRVNDIETFDSDAIIGFDTKGQGMAIRVEEYIEVYESDF